MRIKLFWGNLGCGIEHVWEGEYDLSRGTALGHAGDDGDETIVVQLNGNQVCVSGSSLGAGLLGQVWRQSSDRIEVEFFAG